TEVDPIGFERELHVVVDDRRAAGRANLFHRSPQRRRCDAGLGANLHQANTAAQQRIEIGRGVGVGRRIEQSVDAAEARAVVHAGTATPATSSAKGASAPARRFGATVSVKRWARSSSRGVANESTPVICSSVASRTPRNSRRSVSFQVAVFWIKR